MDGKSKEYILTTRWVDHRATSIDAVINKMLDQNGKILPSRSVTYADWRIQKRYEEHQEILLCNKKIIYNYLNFSCEQNNSGSDMPENAVTKSGYIIVYTYDNVNEKDKKIYYIINKNSDALKLLRLLMGYTGQSEIKRLDIGFDSDFFVWIVKKVYGQDNIISSDSDILSDIIIKSVIGFKGDSPEQSSRIQADGESVMNLLSTLSYFLESNQIFNIRMQLQYADHHNVELYLINRSRSSKNGHESIASPVEKYEGSFTGDTLESELSLLVYLEIMPVLYQAYMNDVDNEEWNIKVYIDFLKQLGKTVAARVDKLISDLQKRSGSNSDEEIDLLE
ncbi:MAG: hypothetical protein MR966_05220 [Lachnospiraceae bacterium]|nr:hypothetical protein [Lachnospiraceae bacterium]